MSTQIDSAKRSRLLHLATTASVVTASTLIVGKLVAWLLTGSVSVLASLVDSIMDALASVINLFAVRYSLQPADAEHRFGHGKAEALAGLGQATFIAGSAVFLILESVDRLLHPEAAQHAMIGIGIMVFSIIATLILLLIQKHVVRLTGSTAIKADSLHYATDLLTNVSIIVALVLGMMGYPGLDPLFALGIAAYILHNAWEIAREAISLLMDRELSDEIRQRILSLAYDQKDVLGVHDLRTRQSGHQYFIQLHLEMNDNLSLFKAHETGEAVEAAIHEAFPDAEVIAHLDPISVVDHDKVQTELQPVASAS